jgi:hypothetical protein
MEFSLCVRPQKRRQSSEPFDRASAWFSTSFHPTESPCGNCSCGLRHSPLQSHNRESARLLLRRSRDCKSLLASTLQWRRRGSNPQPPGCKPGVIRPDFVPQSLRCQRVRITPHTLTGFQRFSGFPRIFHGLSPILCTCRVESVDATADRAVAISAMIPSTALCRMLPRNGSGQAKTILDSVSQPL